jgi:hypothetical protein
MMGQIPGGSTPLLAPNLEACSSPNKCCVEDAQSPVQLLYFHDSLASITHDDFASAAAHSYQPFYLAREDNLPASASFEAAKQEYFMTATTALSEDNEDIRSTMS